MHRRTNLALTALFTGAAGIGFAPVLVRLSPVGPSATAGFRVLFALPLLWGWVKLESRTQSASPQPSTLCDYGLMAGAGLLFVGDLAIWHWSLQFTNVANSTLLTNCAPLFVTLGAWAFFREAITFNFLLGLGLALAGGALLVGNSLGFGRDQLLGDLLALCAALFYGGYQLMVKSLRQRFSTATIMAWSGLVSSPGFFLLAVISGEPLASYHAQGWLVLLLLALLSHVGGQTLIAFAFGHLPASFSSLSLLLQPPVAALLAWIILDEPLSWLQLSGGGLTLLGIFIASQASHLR